MKIKITILEANFVFYIPERTKLKMKEKAYHKFLTIYLYKKEELFDNHDKNGIIYDIHVHLLKG